jgi:hypothetical protein
LASATRQGTEEYALGRSGLVFRSTNGGVDWNAVGSLPVTDAVAITAHGNELYVLTSTGAVARSLDQGAGWTFIAALSQGGMGALAAGGAELVAVTRAGEIAASANGTSWTWRGSVGQLAVRALASDVPTNTGVDPASPGALAFSAPWPNPASRAVSFTFDLEREAVVTLEVFDAAGRRVALPIAGERLPAGRVTRQWRPERLEGGTYFARVVTPGRTLTRGFVWLAGRSSGALR